MDASRRPGTQTESRSRPVLTPYDPVHASTGPVPSIISQRHFLHRHQGNVDSTVSVVEAITHVAELYPGLHSRLPGPSSIANVGLSPVAHQPFVQLHPPTDSWPLPGMVSHPLLPVTFPPSNHRPGHASPPTNDSGPGRDHLSFIANPATSAGAGVTRAMNPMPFPPTEPEHGNMERERERNSLHTDHSYPPIWARSYLAPSAPQVQVQGPGERQYNNNPQQPPPTNTHASAQQSNIQLISPPNLDRRRQFMSQRSRRNMSSQTSAQASRVERQHSNRSLTGNVSTSRARVEGHSRRVAPWSSRAGQTFPRATGATEETYIDAHYVSTKPPPSKRALLSLEEVEISELPEDERTCIICYNDFGDECPEGHAETPRRLPKCKHVFGDRCIKKWLEESDNCPYCRDRVGRVRASDLTIADFAEMPRDASESDQSDELLETFLHMGRSQLRHLPIYARLNVPRTVEEREHHRVWLLHTREAQMRESAESPSRSPVEREDIMVTPPPRAPSDMDPTIHTPTHSHFHREDMMATPPSTVPRLAAQQGPSAPTMPEPNPNIPRPGPMGRNGFGSYGTSSSTQTISPSPESPQNIPTLAEFTSHSLLYDLHPDHGPADGPLFLPSLGSGASRGRSGRGRRC